MPRRALLLVAAAPLVLGACGSEPTPGEMSSQSYRYLAAQEELTLDEVEGKGGIVSEELEQTFVSEGGSPTSDVSLCRYARVLYLRTTEENQYRGTARFCFDADGTSVSVERNRADLPDAPVGG